MSPAINDTTTAFMCIDYLSVIMMNLAGRKINESVLSSDDEPRVLLKGMSFNEFLRNAFELIRENAKENVAVYARMLRAFEHLACGTADPTRKDEIAAQINLVLAYSRSYMNHPDQIARLQERGGKALAACQFKPYS